LKAAVLLHLDDLKVRDVQGIQDSLLKNGELSNKTISDCIVSEIPCS
jgi:hypothetical protein